MATQYPGLSDMFYDGPNVFKTQEGYRRSDEAAVNNQQSLAEALQKQQQDAQLHPLKMEYEQQRARQQRLESDLAEKQQPLKLNKLQYDAQEAEYKDMDRFGEALEKWGSIAEANGGSIPLPLQDRMPKELAAMFSQPDGWKQAKAAGTAMREHSQKWLAQQSKQGSAEDVAQLKAQVEKYKADQRRAGQENAARLAAEARKNAAATAAAGKKDVALKTLDQAYIHFSNLAATAEDPEMRAFYTAQAQQMSDQKFNLVNAQAGAKEAGKVDTGRVADLPTKPAPTAPTVNPPQRSTTTVKKDAQGRILLD
jgi:hypothetical protein